MYVGDPCIFTDYNEKKNTKKKNGNILYNYIVSRLSRFIVFIISNDDNSSTKKFLRHKGILPPDV